MDKFIEPKLLAYLRQKAAANLTPLNGAFELTPLCNLQCRMCYVRMSREQMNRLGTPLSCSDWLKIAEDARRSGMLLLLLTGGEPLLYPEFNELYTELCRMGFIMQINTNGTMIDERMARLFSDLPPSRMNITLYGADAHAYESLCGDKDGFFKVDRGIRLMKEVGVSVKLNHTITRQNVSQLKAVADYAEAHELPLQGTSYLFPPVRNANRTAFENSRLSPYEAASAIVKLFLYQNGREKLQQRMEALKEGKAPSPLGEGDDCAAEGEPSRCGAGRSSFWITWQGILLPCGMMDNIAQDLKTTDFDTAWKNVAHAVSEVRLPAKCASCSKKGLCQTCMAMIYCEVGLDNTAPEYRCALADSCIDAMERTLANEREK
ncbi:MAG: radical SAM protein [Clostridia bacterium]|nr:radical SAM protein [Clostridia bacterium]